MEVTNMMLPNCQNTPIFLEIPPLPKTLSIQYLRPRKLVCICRAHQSNPNIVRDIELLQELSSRIELLNVLN